MAECLVICPADTDHLVLVMAPFRRNRVDADGRLTLRHNSRLHHIGIGRRWSGTNVLILARDLGGRIITQTTENSSASSPSTHPATTSPRRQGCEL